MKKADDFLESMSDDEDELVGDSGEWEGINSVNEESGILKTAAILHRISSVRHSKENEGRSRSDSFVHSADYVDSRESLVDPPQETVIEVMSINLHVRVSKLKLHVLRKLEKWRWGAREPSPAS